MKPGQDYAPKIKSAARKTRAHRWLTSPPQRIGIAFVLLTCWMAQAACSGGFVSPAQVTATAAVENPQAVIAGSIATPTITSASPIPTETPALGAIGGSGDSLPVVPTIPGPTATSLPTRTPAPSNPPATPVAPPQNQAPAKDPPILYYTQAGDTLVGLAARFNVDPKEITSPEKIIPNGLFDPGVLLLIPPRSGETSSSKPLIPDSEVVYSPSALDFEIENFIKDAGGYLVGYKEWRSAGWFDGPGVIRRVAIENSINPRLLLAILEQQSHWVYGQPRSLAETDYPIGWLKAENDKKGLYYQLSWAVSQINKAYYGWRDGTVTSIEFPDGKKLRLAPELNAGTVSILYLFSRLYNQPEWAGLLYGPDGFMTKYEKMFGSPWLRAQSIEPLFPATLTQPPMELPWPAGHVWSFTGGPHSAWGPDGATAALDFAPSATVHGCYKSDEWVTASTSGLVVRSENGVVVLDMDGDGYEQTGWDIMYLHIATDGRIAKGTWVNTGDPIGHPSCEGGNATGTHVHIARKYNGEWILADGPMPFNLNGWIAHAGKALYKGTLINGTQLVISSEVGSYESRITRPLTPP